MKLPSSLLREFASAANQNEEKTNNNAYGTVQISNNQTYVRLDGSDILMPVNSVSNVRNGDRVMVVIENHTATITGNVTSPSATNKDLSELANRVNGKSKVIYSGKEPDGTDFAIGDTWFDTSNEYTIYVWDGSNWSQVELGQNAIAANAVRAKHIYAGSVTAEKIATDAVTADKVKANSISVSKLFIGDMSNLATVNENDENSMVTSPASLATAWAVINQTTGLRGVIKANDSQTQLALSQHQMPNMMSAGDILVFSLRIRAMTTARTVSIRVAAYDKDKVYLGSVGTSIDITTTMGLYSGTIAIRDVTTGGSNLTWTNTVYYTLYISDPNGAGDQLRVVRASIRRRTVGSFETGLGPGYTVNYRNNPTVGPVIETNIDFGDSVYARLDGGTLTFVEGASGTERSKLYPMVFNEYAFSGQLLNTEYGWMCPQLFFANNLYTARGEVAVFSDLSDIREEFNGVDDDKNLQTLTPSGITIPSAAISEWSTLGGCWLYKIGSRVHLHIAVTGLQPNYNEAITTLAEGYRPYGTIIAAGRGNTGSVFASMWVASNGNVTVRSTTANAAVDIEYDAFN